jgi:hypothetical protein
VRGGAIPLLVWGTLLVALLVINGIWTGDGIQVAMFGFAALVMYGAAVALLARSRQALRRGAPEHRSDPDVIPDLSLSSAVIALSAAAILFGFVWAHFLVFLGAGMLLLALGRLLLELRAERGSVRRVSSGERRAAGAPPSEEGRLAAQGHAAGEQPRPQRTESSG